MRAPGVVAGPPAGRGVGSFGILGIGVGEPTDPLDPPTMPEGLNGGSLGGHGAASAKRAGRESNTASAIVPLAAAMLPKDRCLMADLLYRRAGPGSAQCAAGTPRISELHTL